MKNRTLWYEVRYVWVRPPIPGITNRTVSGMRCFRRGPQAGIQWDSRRGLITWHPAGLWRFLLCSLHRGNMGVVVHAVK